MGRLKGLGLAGYVTLVFAATAYAQAPKLEFRLSGFMDAVSFYYRNISPGIPGEGIFSRPLFNPGAASALPGSLRVPLDHTNAYMESRGRLKVDAVMGKGLSGTVFFEMDSTRWGETGSGRGTMGIWGGDQTAVEVKNVYIDVGVPYFGIPIPMMVRVGLQPLYVRPHIFTYTDGTGITAGFMIPPVTINPMWFKAIEGKDASSDDSDIYGLNVSAKIDQLTIGGFGLYYHMNTYPFDKGTTTYGVDPSFKAHVWWAGAYAEGKLGPVDVLFDLVYDRGTVEGFGAAQAASDVKYRGWATRFKVEYPWQKWSVGTTFMYASGADQKKTSSSGLPGTQTPFGTTTTRVNSYVTPPGSEQFAGGESLVIYGSWTNRSDIGYYPFPLGTTASNLTRGQWGGTWFAKVFAGFKATPWYKVSLEAFYIGDTTKNGNTLGDARRPDGRRRDDSTIGWELNLINVINIYQNLEYNIGLGYLIAGDALDQFGGGSRLAVSPKNPWILATRLIYSF